MKLINFVNPLLLRRIRARERARRITLWVLLVALILGGWGVVGLGRIRTARLQLEAIQASTQLAQEKVSQHDKLQARLDQYLAKAEVKKRLRGPLPITPVLKAIETSLPSGVTLSSMDMKRVITNKSLLWSNQKTSSLEKLIPNMDQVFVVELRGIAVNDMGVVQFAQQLGQDPLFVDVKITEGTSYQEDSVAGHRFVIRTEVPLKRDFVFDADGGI